MRGAHAEIIVEIVKIKTCFTTCSNVSIVNIEHVIAGWEAFQKPLFPLVKCPMFLELTRRLIQFYILMSLLFVCLSIIFMLLIPRLSFFLKELSSSTLNEIQILGDTIKFWCFALKGKVTGNVGNLNEGTFYIIILFFLSEFSSQTVAIHRTAGEGRWPSFIPLYHFHPLTNIEIFICNFACEMTITYF